jgi:hypothetical protein
MKEDPTQPLHTHPQYLHGQLLALRVVVIALARLTTDQPTFLQAALQSLELLRTALLSAPVADAQIAAVDELEQLLRRIEEDT